VLLVKTRIGASPIHGLGLFADELIPSGTLTEPEAVRRLLGALGLAAQPPPGRPVTAS
jgi:hypothetical protein